MPALVMSKETSGAAGSQLASNTNDNDDASIFPSLEDADLSTKQWLFKEEDLQYTPSVLAGIPMKQERQNRAKGVNFILQVGILLKLPQITLATASVFLHRFYMRHSMMKDPSKRASQTEFHYYTVAAASVWLAAKVEENCRKMREVVIACVRVAQKDSNKVVDEQDKEYWRWRDNILMLEDKLLEGLCFDLSLESPYKALYDIICRFGAQDNKVFRNAAWAFISDSCLAPLCVLFNSRTIAAASVYAAARSCKVEFVDEDGRPWWEIIGVPLVEIRKACNYMADVYQDAPLREGARQDLYQRTPVSGEEKDAKTRAPGAGGSSSTESTTTRQNANGDHDVPMSRTGSATSAVYRREGSVVSNISDVSRKRGRDEMEITSTGENGGGNDKNNNSNGDVRDTGQKPVSMNDMPWGGESPSEREAKRVKQEAATNGMSELQEKFGDDPIDKRRVDDLRTSKRERTSHGKGYGDGRVGVVQTNKGSEKKTSAKRKEEAGKQTRPEDEDQPMGLVSPDLGGSEEGELDE